MKYDSIESALILSYKDYSLSQTEKNDFLEVLGNYETDTEAFSFARNCAFDLAKASLRESPQNFELSLRWLEKIIKALDSTRNSNPETHCEALFSPGTHCANRIISLIEQARSSIDVCVFTISDDNITAALIKAYRKGIKVRIITDNDKSHDLGSDVSKFDEVGINLRMDKTSSHMHHKFAIFDNENLLNGSFNWTRSASRYNHENITVISDKQLVADFGNIFSGLWQDFA